jgi:hypothetical protein
MYYCVQPPNFEQVGCSLQGVLAQARPKLGMNSFGKKIFMQPMGRPKHAVKLPCFFSF